VACVEAFALFLELPFLLAGTLQVLLPEQESNLSEQTLLNEIPQEIWEPKELRSGQRLVCPRYAPQASDSPLELGAAFFLVLHLGVVVWAFPKDPLV